ncbi:hypothetical protein HYFRA_00004381 [Hymenoscyphus fraxineus]|uniref:Uncharacterized protein n=1 Tax=Hymenoscyphus fraxineus TaxID=746836 RepID=A0A9N9PII3_9HELO|nr:hypothetical protein HYFRA_00004381 [Hymenoscyphus fraxineus]
MKMLTRTILFFLGTMGILSMVLAAYGDPAIQHRKPRIIGRGTVVKEDQGRPVSCVCPQQGWKPTQGLVKGFIDDLNQGRDKNKKCTTGTGGSRATRIKCAGGDNADMIELWNDARQRSTGSRLQDHSKIRSGDYGPL